MARASASSPSSAGLWLTDLLVVAAMVAVSAAVVQGVTAHAGVERPIAMAIGGLLLVVLVSAHVLLRRSEAMADAIDRVARLEEEARRRGGLREEPTPPVGDAMGVAPLDRDSEGVARVRMVEPVKAAPQKPGAQKPGRGGAADREPAARLASSDAAPLASAAGRPAGDTGGVADKAAATSGASGDQAARSTAGSLMDVRPADLRAEASFGRRRAEPVQDDAAEAAQIQDTLNRLARQIEGSRATRVTADGGMEAAPQSAGVVVAPPAVMPEQIETGARMPQREKIAAIAAALAEERIDVFLEPILALEDRRARHYEVTVRLRLDGGAVQARGEYSAAARGTGLLPLVDTVAVARSKRIAWRMMDRGGNGRLFSPLDGESLASRQFREDFDGIVKGDAALAARLVLSFAQDDIRALTPAQWSALSALSAQGFRFALEHVTDLDMDFAGLASVGFEFVKLDARVFLDGLPIGEGKVPAEDICRHLGESGLTAIVGHIDSEAELARLKTCGVAFGQGQLFGGAKPVKAEVLSEQPRLA